MNVKLTPAQERALLRCTDEWQCAYELRASLSTLDAMVRKGILQRKTASLGAMFSPRTANEYRLKPHDNQA